MKRKLPFLFIDIYFYERKHLGEHLLVIENERIMNRFIAKTIHLTRNRTRRNDELIESTWSSHSLSFFLFSTEKTRIRNKDGLGWIIETSFYATRTIHHANCISCGDRQVISKKRINLLELQLVGSFIIVFFLQNFLTFFISSLDEIEIKLMISIS